jgi:hypothetical protein
MSVPIRADWAFLFGELSRHKHPFCDRDTDQANSNGGAAPVKRDAEKDSPSHLWATGANVFAIGIYAARP